jgi:hypothetical protein
MCYADILAGVVQLDPWLAPFKDSLKKRYTKAQNWITALNKTEGGLEKFSRVSYAVPSFALKLTEFLPGKGEVRLQHR